ncbi:MAG: DUF3300 domain-containing protein [Xanthomonadales bacterium]|nr:DUF3300 domain-containing protein [Xanthomonadales bacterium]
MSKALNSLFLSAWLLLGFGLQADSLAAESQGFSQAELDQMLAPVALYPDTVLSQLLIAATYPLEVVQAARWSRAHPGLSGAQALERAAVMDWDPSVQALAAFPDLLDRMDRDLEWTQRLGDAFLLQEEQVLGTVQYLRQQAYAEGNLHTNERVQVVRETQYIYIEPARTQVVYLPYYDPYVVYGAWRWSAYPPVYWHAPAGFSLNLGFYWGSGYRITPAFYFSSFHWPRRQVVVVHHDRRDRHYGRSYRGFSSGRDIVRHEDARRWRHEPRHRRGVSYRRGVDSSRFASAGRPVETSRGTLRTAVSRDNHRDGAAALKRVERSLRSRDARGGDDRRQALQRSRQREKDLAANRRPAVTAGPASRSSRAVSDKARAPSAVGSAPSLARSAAQSRVAAQNRARSPERSRARRAQTPRQGRVERSASPARSNESGARRPGLDGRRNRAPR